MDKVPYLWLNLIGCVLVMGIAVLLQVLLPSQNNSDDTLK
jgi:hypothetical protein